MAIEEGMKPTHIMVEVNEYNDLIKAQKKLTALENGGVDNWEWYGQSMEDGGMFDEDDDEEVTDGR